MATLWVSTSGSSGDDGSTYLLAKDTVWNAITVAGLGDTINVVNDGTYDASGFGPALISSGFIGTDWTNFGLKIQGTDSSGNPDMAVFELKQASNLVYGFRVSRTARFIWFQGLRFFSATPDDGGQNTVSLFELQGNGAGRRIWDCECEFPAPTTNSTYEFVGTASSASGSFAGETEIAYCVFTNMQRPLAEVGAWSNNGIGWKIHHNVFYYDDTNAAGH